MGNHFTIPDGQNTIKVDLITLKSCLNSSTDSNMCFRNSVTDKSDNMVVEVPNKMIQNFGNVDTFESLNESPLGKDYFKNKIFVLIAIIFILYLVFRKK
jgi:hypothetical protein